MTTAPGPWRMPPEWAPHHRTWMAWPSSGYTLGDTEADADAARRTWSEVARAVARFEPVTVLAAPAAAASARGWCGDGIHVVTAPLDDAWMRDIGPTF
ncbi:MAG: agmatine deiminase family protein, partial [Dermatophilaceae bacterium]